jgi:hypothetical protein
MESVANIIGRSSQPEPDELKAIIRYVDELYHVKVHATVRGDTIVVIVPSAALANTLRLQTTRIRETCQLKKRLIFRIG